MKKNYKRLFVVLIATLAITLTLTSCDNEGEQLQVTKSDQTMKSTATVKEEGATITIWGYSDAENDYTQTNAWYDFMKLCKTKGTQQNIDYGEIASKFKMIYDHNISNLEMSILSNTAPDLVRIDHVSAVVLGQEGKIIDLQKEFKITDNHKDKFVEACWKASSYKDAVYGIPFDANTIIWGGMKNKLEEAGQTLPVTYEELLSVGNVLKLKNPDSYPYLLLDGAFDKRMSYGPVDAFMLYVWRLGGGVLNEDYTKAIFNQDDYGVEALRMMLNMKNTGIIGDYREKTVLGEYGTWNINDFKEEMVFSLLPTLKEGVERYSGLGLYDICVVATSKNPKLTYDFAIHMATGIDTMTESYYQTDFCIANRLLPSLKAAGITDSFKKDANKKAFWETSIRQLELSKWRPAVACWGEIDEELSKAINFVIQEGMDPKEALDAAAKNIDELLK